jgi:hypothetical protein
VVWDEQVRRKKNISYFCDRDFELRSRAPIRVNGGGFLKASDIQIQQSFQLRSVRGSIGKEVNPDQRLIVAPRLLSIEASSKFEE